MKLYVFSVSKWKFQLLLITTVGINSTWKLNVMYPFSLFSYSNCTSTQLIFRSNFPALKNFIKIWKQRVSFFMNSWLPTSPENVVVVREFFLSLLPPCPLFRAIYAAGRMHLIINLLDTRWWMSDRVHGCLGVREGKLGSGFVARVAESGGDGEGRRKRAE